MGFLRKKTLRREFDEKLTEQLFKQKEEWNRQKRLVEKSLEPSAEVLYELKVAEAKYFFYLREAKQRNLKISGWK
ncbi:MULTISPECIES: YaaL family protein [unclassified Bacillus (in: firmicutes)]|uniref:YaaL family protein n=1 Tax=unclassified Bacillus (in: firmicutes) TaxID=185979 RepID=UPI00227F42BB|nr:YaaL family protein [Bacillus sp. S20C3]MCY8205812.1 YaaL family protein [Bacillus sp. N12A5]MCY8290351.1 YaaL family protein [Bacillus sp. N13C7]MCY8640292.1 YaaL family protein [Bacillus sp. S17B2]MCY8718184.1 YaaL family protein [Bacillus sp. S10C12M]MCY9145977.1 YaaL family protein [Bacillus sp. T9C1]